MTDYAEEVPVTGVQRCDEILRLIDHVLAEEESRSTSTKASPVPTLASRSGPAESSRLVTMLA